MVITLDVGGTGIKASAFDGDKRLFPPKDHPARSNEDADTVIANFIGILDAARAYAGKKELEGIAMAFPGPFDYEKGIPLMRGLAKYDSIYRMELSRKIAERRPEYDVGYTFINDVSAYALGATTKHGLSGRTAAFAIGTGLGSAFLEDGRILTDGEGVPENGWVYPIPFLDGTIDDYISARGLLAITRRILGKDMDGLDLDRAARAGNEKAKQAMVSFGVLLAEALEPILGRFRPDNVVLGGNIAKSLDLFGSDFQDMVRALPAQLVHDTATSDRITEGAYIDFKERQHDDTSE